MFGYVVVTIAFMIFFEVDLISYIAHVFSKTAVDLLGGFARFAYADFFGEDDTVDYTRMKNRESGICC